MESKLSADEVYICALQLMELLNSKKEELQKLAEQLKSVQLAPADEQEARTACTAAWPPSPTLHRNFIFRAAALGCTRHVNQI